MNLNGVRYIILCCLLMSQFVAYPQSGAHWETILRAGDECRYYIPKSNIGTNWTANDFDDSSWEIGPSGLGYGDNDDNTEVPEGTTCVY
ncbi:MAG TPA: hypothetical protein VJ951_05785, partial [Bacteroidales bacterium]|nr:hypothetical protein [Bacteroidales bacterium]